MTEMRHSTPHIRDLPHYRLSSSELARWLDAQGGESWWSVDGDPLLMERLNFPCQGAELAKLLRRIDKPLLLLDARTQPAGHGEMIGAASIDDIADADQSHDERVLQFCWEIEPEGGWLLCEDLESQQLASDNDSEGQ
jgi:hypothetical protein